jgi:regulator of protease activity HflC (stomatin/prohibitin superfamily)
MTSFDSARRNRIANSATPTTRRRRAPRSGFCDPHPECGRHSGDTMFFELVLLALVAVEKFGSAVYPVALTSLRNIIGQHALDEVLKDRDAINGALRAIVDQTTEAWGVKIEMVEMKDVEIPEVMQRAMAREAEAVREKRARIIKSEAELEAAQKLTSAALLMTESPMALELRCLQMVAEIGAENNTTTVIMLPSDIIKLAANAA